MQAGSRACHIESGGRKGKEGEEKKEDEDREGGR